MKHFNYFLLEPATGNRVNRAFVTAKGLQNTGESLVFRELDRCGV